MWTMMHLLPWKEPKLIKGAGSSGKVGEEVKKAGFNKVLVVTDQMLIKFGLLNEMIDGLKKNGIDYTVYDAVQPNPTIHNAQEARDLYKKENCDAIVAFGGGSPMDCAKAAGAIIARPNKPIPKMRGTLKVLRRIPTLFAIPTTAGTGSETTIAAVISNPETHEKYSLNDMVLRPKYAFLDAMLTLGLPQKMTSTTGLDALTHAVEAYIGKSNTKETKKDAHTAVKLIFENLETAYDDGKNITARGNMLEASYRAGLAFTRAYVGYVHAVAHKLGGMYGIPHGLANSVILPKMLEWYGESVYKPLSELADDVNIAPGKSQEEKAKAFIAAIYALNAHMDIPEGFDAIKEEDIPLLAKRAMKEANPQYPVPKIMSVPECEAFIRSLALKSSHEI